MVVSYIFAIGDGDGARRVDRGLRDIAFIERLDAVRSADEIMRHMVKALGRFGFETFMFARLPDPTQLTTYHVVRRSKKLRALVARVVAASTPFIAA